MKTSARIKLSALLLALAGLGAASATALSAPFELNYGGRLVDIAGKPVGGPVDLQLKLFTHPTLASLLPVTIPVFEDTVLINGAFQIRINLTTADYHTAFNGTDDVWVEVKDITNNKTYPRQRFSAVPYALKVPVDGSTITYNAAGELQALTGGSGDMSMADYDTNAVTTNSVDRADVATDAELLEGESAADFHNAANLTGTLPVANLPVGTTAAHVAAGNDARFTDSRAPNGTAGGGLTGTYPNPTISSVPDAALSGNVSLLGSAISLDTAETTGTLSVAKGGTGAITLTGIVKGNGTGAFTAAALADIPVGFRLNAADGAPADVLYADDAGYVGIGTVSPSEKLEVVGDLKVTTSASGYVSVNNDAGTSLVIADTGGVVDVNLSTNGTNSYIKADGAFFGLGTATPSHKLDVTGNIRAQSSKLYGVGDIAYLQLYDGTAGNVRLVNTSVDPTYGNLTLETANTERVRIDPTGNVGIGTSPTAKLHVGGVAGTDGIKFPDGSLQTTALRAANASVRGTSDQTLATTTFTLLTWDAEDHDSAGLHDNVTNNSRITIPAGAGGLYLVCWNVLHAANATGDRFSRIYKNGVDLWLTSGGSAANTGQTMNSACYTLQLAPGDYLEVYAYQNSGGNLNVQRTNSRFFVTYLPGQ